VLSEPGSHSRRPIQEAYWTYEDIGAFLFVAVALDAVVHLAVRLHLLASSQLLAPGAALEALITAFLTAALYVILKLHYRKPVVAPLGWLLPSRFYTAISILGGVAAALAITYLTRWRGHVMPAIAAKDFFVLGLVAPGSNPRRVGVPRLHASGADAHFGKCHICRRYRRPVCRVSCSRRCHTLGMVYRYRCGLWFTALGVGNDHRSRVHACDMQFDSFPLRQAVIA
jgi:hypothetical protein